MIAAGCPSSVRAFRVFVWNMVRGGCVCDNCVPLWIKCCMFHLNSGILPLTYTLSTLQSNRREIQLSSNSTSFYTNTLMSNTETP
jgi:hypothetical protein